ncbi:14538_t:CDS:2, partial [Funneliformis geosporum]
KYLVENEMVSIDSRIADMDLHNPVDRPPRQIYETFHWFIITGLNAIHEVGLAHGINHGNNISDSLNTRISDIDFVIPFVTPEVFNGKILTKESDIYSFGIIIWMLSAGVYSYYDRSHNLQLVQEICFGLRPSIIEGTSSVYSKLMLKCLDVNPSNRPITY